MGDVGVHGSVTRCTALKTGGHVQSRWRRVLEQKTPQFERIPETQCKAKAKLLDNQNFRGRIVVSICRWLSCDAQGLRLLPTPGDVRSSGMYMHAAVRRGGVGGWQMLYAELASRATSRPITRSCTYVPHAAMPLWLLATESKY